MGHGRVIILLCLLLFASASADAKPVRHIPLSQTGDWVFSILVAPGSTCSFRLPLPVKHILLGNSSKFTAHAIDEKIVAIKPKTAEESLFTTLQMVLENSRIVTINVGVGPQENATREVVFDWEGNSPVDVEIEKRKQQLETSYREKEKNLNDQFETTELNRYMQDILHAYDFHKITGGKVRSGIGLFPKVFILRGEKEAFIKLRIDNRSDQDFPIAQLQVLHQRQHGFLWMAATDEAVLESRLLCEASDNIVKAKSETICVVSFEMPKRPSNHWYVALQLTEAAARKRKIRIHRIKELYE